MSEQLLLAGAKGVGSVFKGVAAFKQGQYTQKFNALQADRARELGVAQGEVQTRAGRKAVGAAKARAGAGGITFSGSALDVTAQLAAEAEQRAATSRWEGEARAVDLNNAGRAAKRRGTQKLFGAAALGGVSVLAAAL